MISTLRSEIHLLDVVRSLFFNSGYSDKLEGELARYFGVRKALLTHSCRSGIYFLLKVLPQERVYLPAYNCWAVSEAALYAGKDVRYVDISLADYNMDIARLRESLLPDSIILATHQFGMPCDIEAILELARERNCIVLEDSAAAFGSAIAGKKTGSFAPAGVVSFDYSKMVVSGKGGAILFNDEELHRKVRSLQERETKAPGCLTSLKYALLPLAYSYATHRLAYRLTYAMFQRIRGNNKSEAGCDLSPGNPSYTLRFDAMRAKLAFLSMKRLDRTMAQRRRVTEFYRAEISDSPRIVPPEPTPRHDAALIKYPFRLKDADKKRFYDRCVAKGIDIPFLFQFHYGGDACPNAGTAAREAMALPVYASLSAADLQKIKSVVVEDANPPSAGRRPGLVEQRKLFFFTINYFWMDIPSFLESRNSVSLLRTSETLNEKEYAFRLVYKTFLVDLGRTNEEIYAGFDYTRAICPIKKAIKAGVTVKHAETAVEKERYYRFYQDFANDPKRKNKILVVQRSELEKLEILYAVSGDGEYLGGIGLLPSSDGRFLLAKYSATLHKFSEQDLLVWEAMRYAKEAGFSFFDLSWMLPSDDKESQQYRLFQYKKKFGGELVDFYSYVKLKGAAAPLGYAFRGILRVFFGGNIDRFASSLKKMGAFK